MEECREVDAGKTAGSRLNSEVMAQTQIPGGGVRAQFIDRR